MSSTIVIEPARDVPRETYLLERQPRYVLRADTRVAAPLERVFEFFSLAENLERLTPDDLSFTILTPRPIEMRVGASIDYRIRLGPVPMKWRTRIDVWEPGRRFVDAQLAGPYACWWHEHRFVAEGRTTRMFDTVFYSPPFGPLGALAHGLFVKPKLLQIFGYRERAIGELFGGD
ncbi:MAG: SRPBCC family protein [Planctomycetes bacterium]|nr:SRPBCC family protein [Planctomycetota bacterium]